jgi:hypothetical protein
VGFFNGTDNNDDDEECPASGWGVRPASTRRADGSERCSWGHSVETEPVGNDAVRISRHRR